MQIKHPSSSALTSYTLTNKQKLNDLNVVIQGANRSQKQMLASANVSISEPGKLAQAADKLFNEMDNVLKSHLSDEQKNELGELTAQLEKFEAMPNLSASDEKQALEIEEKIHGMLEGSLDKLSTDERQKIEGLSQQIESIEQAYELAVGSGN